jgi:hypothetical protein
LPCARARALHPSALIAYGRDFGAMDFPPYHPEMEIEVSRNAITTF